MADNVVLRNRNEATEVNRESAIAADETITPGHVVGFNADGEAVLANHADGTGTGEVAILNEHDPETDRDTQYDPDADRLRFAAPLPVGGEADLFLAAGGDLATAADADISEGDILAEVDNGALADEAATTGGGARYRAIDTVDNSGAAAGVDNQVRIAVRRIA